MHKRHRQHISRPKLLVWKKADFSGAIALKATCE